MTALSITYPSFTSGTTIVSNQVNQNNTDLVNYINARNAATANWDAVSTVGAFTSTLTSSQIILGTTRTVTITAPTPASLSRVWTIPDITSAGTFAALEGTQTFAGSKTFTLAVGLTAGATATGSITNTGSISAGTANIKTRLTVVDNSSSSTTPGTNPIVWIGGGNTNVSTCSEIGFIYGQTGVYSETNSPVTIGYQLTSGSGNTKGDIVMCTRNVTTDTVPTERLRVLAAGPLQLKYAPGSVSDGGLQMYDPTTQAAGVGAQINLGGCYTGTTTTQFGRIKTSKLSSVDANLDTQMIFGVRSNGAGFVDVVTLDGNSQDLYTVAYTDYGGSSTIVGWTSFTKQNIYYKKIGRTVHVWLNIDGTSNATTISFTLPYTAVNTIENLFAIRARDNNVDGAAPGVVQVTPNSATIQCYKDWAFTGWTASGRKIAEGYFCYQTT